MKKFFKFACLSTIVLAGVVSLNSCSSNDEVDVNPTFDGSSVKTQFSISIPRAAQTRMASGAAQETGTFLGLKNIKLLPFATTPTTGSETLNGATIALTDISALDADHGNSKVYTDVAIHTGTSNFLFYGDAGKDAGFDHGALTVEGLTTVSTPAAVKFTPKQIVTSTEVCGGSSAGSELLTLLTNVANVSGWSATTNVQLKNVYNSFITMTAGSSASVKEALEDLYNSVSNVYNIPGTSTADQTLIDAIKAAITTTPSNTFDATAMTLTLASKYTGYPADINLPDGAARVKWDDSAKKFVDNHAVNNAVFSGMNIASLNTYVYPANLQYFVNSTLKAKDSKVTDDNNKYTQATWNDVITTGYSGAAASVAETTRSVAIEKPIQYGVGMLKTIVNQLPATMYDYTGAPVTTTNGFTLTGVLIGGQKQVGWDFTLSSPGATLSGTEYSIYDKSTVSSTINTTTASTANYTLALESDANISVYIALEFTNNGDDFVGAAGAIIPKGGKFYLVGSLKPSDGGDNYGTGDGKTNKIFTQDFETDATFSIAAGKSKAELVSDGSNNNSVGLGTATNTIPDLRTPQLELGLSVDLSWTPGLVFAKTL